MCEMLRLVQTEKRSETFRQIKAQIVGYLRSGSFNSCANEDRTELAPVMSSATEFWCNQFATDEIKTLCLLQCSGSKVIGRQNSGSYLLRRGKIIFEVTPLSLSELLPNNKSPPKWEGFSI